MDSNRIWEKQSHLDNLRQREGEGSKAGEFNVSKGWFDNFIKKFGLKKCQNSRRSSFCWPRSSRWILDTIRKIIEKEGYLTEQVFNRYKSALLQKKKKCHKGHLLVRRRSKHQDLRQERVGWFPFVQMQSALWSELPLSIKLLTPEPWREKINTRCQSFICIRPG